MIIPIPKGIGVADLEATYGVTREQLQKANVGADLDNISGRYLDLPLDMGFSIGERPVTLEQGVREYGDILGDMDEEMMQEDLMQEDLMAPMPEDQLLSWLKEDEGFSQVPYTLENDRSGVTVGMGIDLGHWSEEDLRRVGAPVSFIEKVRPALGKRGADARAVIKDIPPLSLSEVQSADKAVTSHTIQELQNNFQERWSKMSPAEQGVALSARHQYGQGFYNQNAYKQLAQGDTEALRANLMDWGDRTPKHGDAINERYRRWATRL